MSKAALIEFWRDLILSDDALESYKSNRDNLVCRADLTEQERHSLLSDDFAAIYRSGVPLELLFQGILLAGLNPREYMSRLHSGLGYSGRGYVDPQSISGDAGNFTPSA